MKTLILFLSVVSIAACTPNNSDIGGTATVDVNLQDNLTQCEVRQNGNTLFIKQTGLDNYTMALDPGVVYDDNWAELTIVDSKRVTPLTPIETDIITGVQ